MSPGWMPSWPRPMRARRMISTRRRRTRLPAHLDSVLFAPELPVASVYSIEGALHRWADRRLAWLRPRALPALVAMLALVGLVAVTQHLPHLAAPRASVPATAPVIDLTAPSSGGAAARGQAPVVDVPTP